MFTNTELNELSNDLAVRIAKDITKDALRIDVEVGASIVKQLRAVIEQAKEFNRLSDKVAEDKNSRIVPVPDVRNSMDGVLNRLNEDFETVEDAQAWIDKNKRQKEVFTAEDGGITYGKVIEGKFDKAVIETFNGKPYVYVKTAKKVAAK